MNQQILSQDEVDALLQGITGESQKLEQEEAPTDGIRPYDLASQERIVRGRMPTMEIINERFARNIRVGLFNMIRKASLSIVTLDETAVGFGEAYKGLAEMFGRVEPLLNFYWKHREDFGNAFTALKTALETVNANMPQMIKQLQTSMDAMRKTLDSTGGMPPGAPVLATDVCFPTATVSC